MAWWSRRSRSVEALRGSERMDPRAPERLVDVDVPHPGERALVEQRRLHRRPPPAEAFAEPGGGEERVERLVAETRGKVRVDLARLEQLPRAEAADVAVRDVRSVV